MLMKYYCLRKNLIVVRKFYTFLGDLNCTSSFTDLSLIKDNDDPFCQLLAWELELVMKYDLKEHSRKLKDCVQNIQNVWGEENTYLNNTLLFLIQLRNVPVDTSTDVSKI